MKTFLITGASTGIGEATARKAFDAGYNLVLAARSKDKLDALVNEFGDDRALAVACDVTKEDEQTDLAKAALDKFGAIDIVFANAGIGASGSGTAGGEPDNWQDMIMTNLFGVIMTCRATLDAVKDSKGHFVITSSVAGRRTLKGSIYGATKWGVTGYGRNLREEVKEDGVRVTLIEPGMVKTPFFDEAPDNGLDAVNIADAVMYAVSQPSSVNVSEVLVMPN
jgi:NADP-dependent 3-hydroxy acid dehydrogenase YdfG